MLASLVMKMAMKIDRTRLIGTFIPKLSIGFPRGRAFKPLYLEKNPS
jgi:retron-type reverse transcriptase